MKVRDVVILGNINVDLVLGPLEGWPRRGTEQLLPELRWRVGGNAGNAALACLALGTDALAVSPVGADLAGEWLRRRLPAPGVIWLEVPGETSVTVALTHPDGERTFLTHLGHLASLRWAHLRPHTPEARYTLLAGAFLTPGLRADYPELLRARRCGSQIALDPGWPDGGFTEEVRREIGAWLPHVDHLLLNDLEAMSLTGQPSVERALTQLSCALPPGATAVAKLGARGVLACSGGELLHVPAPPTRVLDTVGAGDTWNAAYLHAHAAGRPLPACLEDAVRCASLAISTHPREFGGRAGAVYGREALLAEGAGSECHPS